MRIGFVLAPATWAALTFLAPATAAADAACFPACRAGYVCAPGGTCVSACNPPCGSGERCESGECRASKTEGSPEEHGASGKDEERTTHFVMLAGGMVQVIGELSQGPFGIANASAPAFTTAFHVEAAVGEEHRLFLGPRFALAFYEQEKVPEFGLDAGWRARFGRGLVRVGPAVWLEPQIMKGKAFLPYVGLKAGAFVEIGAFVVDAVLGGGLLFDTTHTNVYTAGVFDAGGEAGVRF